MREQDQPPIQIHIEPDGPIGIYELTGALEAFSRQYEAFAVRNGYHGRASDARLLVTSVKPGSIDIGLLPEIAGAAPILVALMPFAEFANHLKGLLEWFKENSPTPSADVNVRDCDDVIAIAQPVANHGGTQSINIHNGNVYQPVIVLSTEDAKGLIRAAAAQKALLEYPKSDKRERVALVWHGLENSAAKIEGKRSPDKAVIQEVCPDPKPVFFEDALSHLKSEMLEGDDNPYQKVYFVDVLLSRVGEKVVAYKVIAFHGSDDLAG